MKGLTDRAAQVAFLMERPTQQSNLLEVSSGELDTGQPRNAGSDSCDTRREMESHGHSYADTVVRGGIGRGPSCEFGILCPAVRPAYRLGGAVAGVKKWSYKKWSFGMCPALLGLVWGPVLWRLVFGPFVNGAFPHLWRVGRGNWPQHPPCQCPGFGSPWRFSWLCSGCSGCFRLVVQRVDLDLEVLLGSAVFAGAGGLPCCPVFMEFGFKLCFHVLGYVDLDLGDVPCRLCSLPVAILHAKALGSPRSG